MMSPSLSNALSAQLKLPARHTTSKHLARYCRAWNYRGISTTNTDHRLISKRPIERARLRWSTQFRAKSSSVSDLAPSNTNSSSALSEALVVTRHGSGDGVICLNVGGTEFVTLRSTVYLNEVLRTHVLRAEANAEFTHGGTAVFIDRDPTHFPLILQHLRNQSDGLESSSRWNMKDHSTLIQIPKDAVKIRELYVEARHFQIRELEATLCKHDYYLQFASFVGGSGSSNPFQEATRLITTARRALLATGGFGVIFGRDEIGGLINNVKDIIIGTTSDAPEAVETEKPSTEPSLAS